MSVYEQFTGFARNTMNTLLGMAVVAYIPAFDVPGIQAEAKLAGVSTAMLITALGMRVLECCAWHMDQN